MNTILFVGEHSKTYDVQWHAHDHWELVYCTGGEGTFRFSGGTLLHYREGNAVAIPPRERHANVSQDGFTNIHLRMADPSFPYKSPFRVSDDLDRHLLTAFQHAQYYSLAEVARLCGYDDALYFSRVFKKSLGCAPPAFAKQQLREQDKKA